jgi:hypothetical protein
MRSRWAAVGAAVLLLAGGGIAYATQASAEHTVVQCDAVRAQVAQRELVLSAAEEAGGLTPEQVARIADERAINAAALRHCGTTPSPSPTRTATPSPTATATPTATSTSRPPAAGFPNPATTGVPAGWTPRSSRTTDLRVTTAGSTVEDVRIVGANLIIDAANVTVRRVEIQGGRIINDPGSSCRNGLVLEDVSLIRAPGQTTQGDTPVIQAGGYTARRVKIDGVSEGFRVGGRSLSCGPVTIENSFARVRYPDVCGDWHGDGLQGYDGPALTLRNSTMELIESGGCGGTAAFFYPSGQGNTSATIDGLLVKGGGYPFRMGMPGSVKGLRIVDRSWGYGPIDVNCGALSSWEASIVAIDANYQVTSTVRAQPCNSSGGS